MTPYVCGVDDPFLSVPSDPFSCGLGENVTAAYESCVVHRPLLDFFHLPGCRHVPVESGLSY